MIPKRERALIAKVRTALPVEFTSQALEDIEDIQSVARALSHAPELGRVACGQADPRLLIMSVDGMRVLYRLEDEQIVVLGAEPIPEQIH